MDEPLINLVMPWVILKPATLESWLKVTVLPAEREVAIFANPVAVEVDCGDVTEFGWLTDNLEYA